jgi:hypothetical protein
LPRDDDPSWIEAHITGGYRSPDSIAGAVR